MASDLRSRPLPKSPSSTSQRTPNSVSNGPSKPLSEPPKESIHEAYTGLKPNRLMFFSELPGWLQDNAYITSHYRPPSYSIPKSLYSLTYLHNETVNIYSHLLPALFVPFISYYLYTRIYLPSSHPPSTSNPAPVPSLYSTLTPSDLVVWTCFAFGIFTCLGMSATYHCIRNISPPVNKWGNQLDYVGIVALIWGSFVPSLWYGFWCEKEWLRVYIRMVR